MWKSTGSRMLNNVSLLCRRVTYYKGHLALDTLTKTELRDMEGDPLTSLDRIQQHGYAQGHDHVHVGMIMLPDAESHHTNLCAKPATMKSGGVHLLVRVRRAALC